MEIAPFQTHKNGIRKCLWAQIAQDCDDLILTISENLPILYYLHLLGQFTFSFPVTKAQKVLAVLQKPRKTLNHNLIVNFAVMLESMKWNAMMKRKKQHYLWTNALTKIIGSKISNTNIMPEKGQQRAKLTPKDSRGMSKSILFLGKMSPKVNHQK